MIILCNMFIVMNVIKKSNKIYKYESIWREVKNPKNTKKDSNGKYFPWPEPNRKWNNRNLFLESLKI